MPARGSAVAFVRCRDAVTTAVRDAANLSRKQPPANGVAAGPLGETVSLLRRIHRFEQKRRGRRSSTRHDGCERTRIRDAAAGEIDAEASPLPRIVESFSDMVPGDAIAGAIARHGISTARTFRCTGTPTMFGHVPRGSDTPRVLTLLKQLVFEQLRGRTNRERRASREPNCRFMDDVEDRIQFEERREIVRWDRRKHRALESRFRLPSRRGCNLPPDAVRGSRSRGGVRQSDYSNVCGVGRGIGCRRCGWLFTAVVPCRPESPPQSWRRKSDETGFGPRGRSGVADWRTNFPISRTTPRFAIPGPDQTALRR